MAAFDLKRHLQVSRDDMVTLNKVTESKTAAREPNKEICIAGSNYSHVVEKEIY